MTKGMTMKRLLAASALISLAQAAQATEYVSDPTLATNPATLGAGWTHGSGKITGTAVAGTRAAITVPGIAAGDIVRYRLTVINRTAGSVQVSVGAPSHGSSGSDEPVTDGTNGQVAIPDNFTTSLGLGVGAVGTIDNSTEVVGAFRFGCNVATYEASDPLLVRGFPGASHLHQATGNTGFSANVTYKSLRLSGSSSCGSPKYPLNRSEYWTPAMLNGSGGVAMPFWQNFYYKRFPSSFNCNGLPSASNVGICVPIPNGLKYLWGYSMATGTGGPTDTDPTREGHKFGYECRQHADINTRDATANAQYKTMEDVVDAGCPVGSVLYVFMEGPDCWDGGRTDSATHKSHVSFTDPSHGSTNVSWTILGVAQTPSPEPRCPATHPYKIPTFSWQMFYQTDPTFFTKKWRLSSDEMVPGVEHGTTLHMDYMEAWSPTFKADWELHCLQEHRTCSQGEDGIGGSMNALMPTPGTTIATSKSYEFIPADRMGMSKRIEADGTYTGELTALSGGTIYLYSGDGFTGDVDYWSVVSVTKAPKRSGTITHTH